jgi:hypothetical protein
VFGFTIRLQFRFCEMHPSIVKSPFSVSCVNMLTIQIQQKITFSCDCLTGSISTADGSALVRIGNTSVICGIKAVSVSWQ